MSQQLANCPFCGRQQLQVNHHNHAFRVTCRCCSATGPHHAIFDKAVEEWNLLSEAVRESKNGEAQGFAIH